MSSLPLWTAAGRRLMYDYYLVELPASVDSSLDFLSLSALPIYGPVIAYMVCASESSPGMPPGHCLREALAVSSY